MRRARALAVALVALSIPVAAYGAILPSFDLEGDTWNATHIVVATEGEKIDGVLDVLESWRGDLKPGDQITVPELAEFKNEDRRKVHQWFQPGRATSITCQRMVLFLKQKKGRREPAKRWKAAHPWGGPMSVSVAWIENGDAYSFVQIMNPGGSVLVSLGKTEADIKSRVVHILEAKDALVRARAIADPAERVRALEPLTASDVGSASAEAFDALGECGKAALPILRRMVKDDPQGRQSALLFDALSRAGGEEVGRDLTAVVEEELPFWKTTAPKLTGDWWNAHPDTERLRDRYMRLYEALLSLKNVRYAGCEKAVTELRDFWRSLPQLEDKSGLDQMSKTCDDVLRAQTSPPDAKATAGRRRFNSDDDDPEDDDYEEEGPNPVPESTAEDERRLSQLEETLAAEIDAEKKLPARRREPLRGSASGEELNRALRTIRSAAKIEMDLWHTWEDRARRPLEEGRMPLPYDKGLEPLREMFAPDVAALAKAQTADRVELGFVIEKDWKAAIGWHRGDDDANGHEFSRTALVLEALHHLDAGETEKAGRAVADLWRLQHDLRYDERLLRLAGGLHDDVVAVLASAVIARLDGDALSAFEREFAVLEKTVPSFAPVVRRRRLAYGCYFRAMHKGELRREGRFRDPSPLDHLPRGASAPSRRVGSLRREWERLDVAFRRAEDAAAKLPAHQVRGALESVLPGISESSPKTSVEGWVYELGEKYEVCLCDRTRLHMARLLVKARRFMISHGRWPKDSIEACGEDVAARTDPSTAEPLDLVAESGGSIRVSVSGGAKSSTAVLVPLPPSSSK